MANNKNLLFVAGALAVIVLVLKSKSATGAGTTAAPQGASFDLSQLSDQYGADNVQRLQNLYNAMLSAQNPDNGNPLTTFQQQIMLAQALLESGLFTSNPNYHNVDALNNYTGIKGNSRYPAQSGQTFAYYPDLPTFVNDWLYLLTIKNDPLSATTVNDFINRLLANGYIVSGDVASYQSNIPVYFNLLTNIAQ